MEPKRTDGVMRVAFAFAMTCVVACVFGLISRAAPAEEKTPTPRYDAKGQLLRPADYRDWEFLSAGFGMNYSPGPDSHEQFTNVFVQRWAYREFLASGKWPEHSMFVIDERDAETKGSINKKGHFQTGLSGLAVEVKDTARNSGTWAYYTFGSDSGAAAPVPKENCWSCHEQHASVEHTFVQFYPTLKPVAKKFGSYNEAREKIE
jgi:hypothetical protein